MEKTYSLPHKEYAKDKRGTFYFKIFVLIILLSLIYFISKSYIQSKSNDYLVLLVFLLLFEGFLLIDFFIKSTKKIYVELTEEYIIISTLYKKSRYYWKDIYDAEVIYKKIYTKSIFPYKETLIVFRLKQDRKKFSKRSFNNSLNRFFGEESFSFGISLNIFRGFDKDKLVETLNELL